MHRVPQRQAHAVAVLDRPSLQRCLVRALLVGPALHRPVCAVALTGATANDAEFDRRRFARARDVAPELPTPPARTAHARRQAGELLDHARVSAQVRRNAVMPLDVPDRPDPGRARVGALDVQTNAEFLGPRGQLVGSLRDLVRHLTTEQGAP